MTCIVCGTEKVRGRCKACKKLYDSARKSRSGRSCNEVRLYQKYTYRMKYPEKEAAQQAVRRALKTGVIKRELCNMCGSVDVEAHHDNYNEPLRVLI